MLRIEFEQEEDGRFIAEIPELSGVMAYGATQREAREKVEALALRALADQLGKGVILLYRSLRRASSWLVSLAPAEAEK